MEAGEIWRIEDLVEKKDAGSLFKNHIPYILVDRIVVKEFDEDDIHRISDSVGTAFYEGEGDVYLEIQFDKPAGLLTHLPISTIGSSSMEYCLKSPCPICFHLIILLAPAPPAKDSARYWV